MKEMKLFHPSDVFAISIMPSIFRFTSSATAIFPRWLLPVDSLGRSLNNPHSCWQWLSTLTILDALSTWRAPSEDQKYHVGDGFLFCANQGFDRSATVF